MEESGGGGKVPDISPLAMFFVFLFDPILEGVGICGG